MFCWCESGISLTMIFLSNVILYSSVLCPAIVTAIFAVTTNEKLSLLFFFFHQRAEMNLPPLQAEARLKCDIKAIRTIAITIATYFLCYVPSIVVAVVGVKHGNQTANWYGFTAWYCLEISSAVNPIIYYLRTNRFRSAFRQFLENPLGSSDFKEKPSGRSTGVKRKVNVTITRKRDDVKARSGKTLEVQFDENQARQNNISGEKKEMVTLAIKNLSTQDPCISLLSFRWRKWWMNSY